MDISIVFSTRNRALALARCLDSLSAAIQHAGVTAEVVIADNGSTDTTAVTLRAWANGCDFPVVVLFVARPGKAHALNCAIAASRGRLLVLTDDDCCLAPNHLTDALRHDAADTGLVLRGGRVELGDPSDLPLTIRTYPSVQRWSQAENSIRYGSFAGNIVGANMVMRRAVFDLVGPFDTRFGPGSKLLSGDDTDYLFRAYLLGVLLEYVPDMTVLHFHGRKTIASGQKIIRDYLIAEGGIFIKYLVSHPKMCRQYYWDFKKALYEIVKGTAAGTPDYEFSYRKRAVKTGQGALIFVRECLRSLTAPETL